MTALSPEELSTESLAEVMAAGGRPADSEREIKIIDTTLRDAHQSIWATRMTTEHILLCWMTSPMPGSSTLT